MYRKNTSTYKVWYYLSFRYPAGKSVPSNDKYVLMNPERAALLYAGLLEETKFPSGAEADVKVQCFSPHAKVQCEPTAGGEDHMVAARTCERNHTLEKMKYHILPMDII